METVEGAYLHHVFIMYIVAPEDQGVLNSGGGVALDVCQYNAYEYYTCEGNSDKSYVHTTISILYLP